MPKLLQTIKFDHKTTSMNISGLRRCNTSMDTEQTMDIWRVGVKATAPMAKSPQRSNGGYKEMNLVELAQLLQQKDEANDHSHRRSNHSHDQKMFRQFGSTSYSLSMCPLITQLDGPENNYWMDSNIFIEIDVHPFSMHFIS